MIPKLFVDFVPLTGLQVTLCLVEKRAPEVVSLGPRLAGHKVFDAHLYINFGGVSFLFLSEWIRAVLNRTQLIAFFGNP